MSDDVASNAPDPTAFAAAVDALRQAHHIVALTGAGISKDSGLPTFREAQTGLWSRFRPEELATPEAFARDPALVWRWYAWRRQLVARAEPNPGHHALVTLARVAPRFTLITQNVDGLHRRAGSADVIELHGDITRIRCASCNAPAASGPLPPDAPPRCDCGGLFRPDVVWFGESLPADALACASRHASVCDVFLAIGTSGIVYPAAGLAALAQAGARSSARVGAASLGRGSGGAVVINVNPDPASAPVAALQLTGSASAVLPALVAALAKGTV